MEDGMIYVEKEIKKLILPEIYFKGGKEFFLDPFRKRLIYKTPEEKVRQLTALYFMEVLNVPYEMIMFEQILSHYGVKSNKRADIIIHRMDSENELMYPQLIIECKGENVIIDDHAVKQAINYANKLECEYVVITNGIHMLPLKYIETKNEYARLKKIPNYNEMISGRYEPLPRKEVRDRVPFNQLKNQCDLYLNQEIGASTPKYMLPFLTNLVECILDETHQLPQKKYDIFELKKDYGNRVLSYGNASGGRFYGVYRSFIVRYNGNDEIVSVGFSTYSTSARPNTIRTCLNVAIDSERTSHHSLQLVIDDSLSVDSNKFRFSHSVKI